MAKYDIICMIDADLQYPPEAIVPMYQLMIDHDIDMVLTEREDHETSKLRQLSSKIFNFAFTRLLFGFHYDSQSGLKLFKKTVVEQASLNPTPWSFDLEFIVRALENNFKILSHKIPFSDRYSGEAKVRVIKVTYELAKASVKLRFNSSPRKVKKAYRMNLQLAARVLSVLLVPLIGLLTAAIMSSPGRASALPLTDTLITTVNNLTAPLLPGQQTPPPLIQGGAPTPAPAISALSQSPSSSQSGAAQANSKNIAAPESTPAAANPQPAGPLTVTNQANSTEVKGATTPTYPPSRSASSFTYRPAQKSRFNGAMAPLIIAAISALVLLGSIPLATRLKIGSKTLVGKPGDA